MKYLIIVYACIQMLFVDTKASEILSIVLSKAVYQSVFFENNPEIELVTYYDSDKDCYVTTGYYFNNESDRIAIQSYQTKFLMSDGLEKEYYNMALKVVCISYNIKYANQGAELLLSLREGEFNLFIKKHKIHDDPLSDIFDFGESLENIPTPTLRTAWP